MSSCFRQKWNFNPRSREGSDQREQHHYAERAISIHAPVKGATSRLPSCRTYGKNFNPRSREGSDIGQGGISVLRRIISIHAPVKGATRSALRQQSAMRSFQSTLP